MSKEDERISLAGSVSLGTGVMIGAVIFALVGQVAGFAGDWFPLAFLMGAIVAGVSPQDCRASLTVTRGPSHLRLHRQMNQRSSKSSGR